MWSTLLSVLVFAGSMLWHAGFPQWGFVLFFGALWLFFTLCLANDRFNEESSLILAQVVDENADELLDRIRQLEEIVGATSLVLPQSDQEQKLRKVR